MESVKKRSKIVFTPCMPEGGKFWNHEGRACEKCPGKLIDMKCSHSCHKKRRVVRRSPR